jgi:hypothetical protein
MSAGKCMLQLAYYVLELISDSFTVKVEYVHSRNKIAKCDIPSYRLGVWERGVAVSWP